MKVSGNAILLTGASSGIGKALFERLHALGNRLLVTSRSESSLAAIREQFPDVAVFCCDLARPAEVNALVEYCRSQFSDLNLLINNAGIQFEQDWTSGDTISSHIDQELQVNLNAPLQLIHGLLPLLMDKPAAAIVNVSSALAISPKRSAPVYCASKSGLRAFSKALRYQLQGSTVNVVDLIPPLVDTPMTAGRGSGKISPEQLLEGFLRGFQQGREEIYVGKARLLRLIHRLSPRLADRIVRDG